jgi:hypothetical protein
MKYNRKKEMIIITNRQIHSSIIKRKFDNKLDKL